MQVCYVVVLFNVVVATHDDVVYFFSFFAGNTLFTGLVSPNMYCGSIYPERKQSKRKLLRRPVDGVPIGICAKLNTGLVEDYGVTEPRYGLAALLGVSEKMIQTNEVQYSFPTGIWVPVLYPDGIRGGSIKITKEDIFLLAGTGPGGSDEDITARADDTETVLGGRINKDLRPMPNFDRMGVLVKLMCRGGVGDDTAEEEEKLGVVYHYNITDGTYMCIMSGHRNQDLIVSTKMVCRAALEIRSMLGVLVSALGGGIKIYHTDGSICHGDAIIACQLAIPSEEDEVSIAWDHVRISIAEGRERSLHAENVLQMLAMGPSGRAVTGRVCTFLVSIHSLLLPTEGLSQRLVRLGIHTI